MAGTVQETSPSDMLGGQGADFLRGVAFWSIRSLGLLRLFCDGCRTLYDLAAISWQAQYFRGRDGKIAEGIGTRLSPRTQLSKLRKSPRLASISTWSNSKLRKSPRLASFVMLPNSKTEDASRNGFIFDVVKFKDWGSVANCLVFDAVKCKS